MELLHLLTEMVEQRPDTHKKMKVHGWTSTVSLSLRHHFSRADVAPSIRLKLVKGSSSSLNYNHKGKHEAAELLVVSTFFNSGSSSAANMIPADAALAISSSAKWSLNVRRSSDLLHLDHKSAQRA